MNALIIVDLQNDFVEGGALAVPGGRELIPLVNQLQTRFDLVVATQDWHPDDHGSFADNQENKKPGDIAHLQGIPHILWPAHCVQGTPGADFIPGLNRDRWAAVFQKGIVPGIDSYSGFFDNGKLRATGLGDFLKERGVTEVYVLGLVTDYCVKFTALDTISLGFKTTLIEDACRGVNLNPGDVEKAVEKMRQQGVEIVRAAEILKKDDTVSDILFEGRFIRMKIRDDWEYVERCKTSGIVVILPITDQRELILVEQFRPPVNRQVIEIPAGLAGDIKGEEDEALATAARRELLEETGYEAEEMEYLTDGPPSAGLSTEIVTFFRARGLRKVAEGGGDGSENIQVHTVPLAELESWIAGKRNEGCLIDCKVYAALYFEGK